MADLEWKRPMPTGAWAGLILFTVLSVMSAVLITLNEH